MGTQKDAVTPTLTLTAVVCATAKRQKQPKHPPTGGDKENVVRPHNGILFSHERKEILTRKKHDHRE